MSAGAARPAATSRTNHDPATTPDVVSANSPKAMSQTKTNELYVYGIHFTVREFHMMPESGECVCALQNTIPARSELSDFLMRRSCLYAC